MCSGLTTSKINLMVSQLHGKQRCNCVCCSLWFININELFEAVVVMCNQLARTARAVEIMPIMTADN